LLQNCLVNSTKCLQACDRFGWFQTGNSDKQVFGSKYPQVSYFTKMCQDLFDNQ
jgi:Serine carboxypeptidase S28